VGREKHRDCHSLPYLAANRRQIGIDETMLDKHTVFIVDDHEATRNSVAMLVGPMGVKTETYASAEEFLVVGQFEFENFQFHFCNETDAGSACPLSAQRRKR
jgi:hypothetical protein